MDTRLPWFVAIGASGGEGLADIKQLLRELPAGLPAVVMIVLHRPWDRLSNLRNVLGSASALPVVIASNRERFETGIVYIGEPGDHLTLAAKSFSKLVSDPHRAYRNRTVDLLFRSVAEFGGNRLIGVILSGALDDGSRGLSEINQAGGLTMVVTPDHCDPSGMPTNAVDFDGPIDVIGSPPQIAAAIRSTVGHER
jgi:chemotaxis response regulator CheB